MRRCMGETFVAIACGRLGHVVFSCELQAVAMMLNLFVCIMCCVKFRLADVPPFLGIATNDY